MFPRGYSHKNTLSGCGVSHEGQWRWPGAKRRLWAKTVYRMGRVPLRPRGDGNAAWWPGRHGALGITRSINRGVGRWTIDSRWVVAAKVEISCQ